MSDDNLDAQASATKEMGAETPAAETASPIISADTPVTVSVTPLADAGTNDEDKMEVVLNAAETDDESTIEPKSPVAQRSPSPPSTSPADAPDTTTLFDASNNFGFPYGYFIIRSMASGKLLNVPDGSTLNDTELDLRNESEGSLVEGECTSAIGVLDGRPRLGMN